MTIAPHNPQLPPPMWRHGEDRPGRICDCGDHAFASLTIGFVALVSPQDAYQLDRKWHASVNKRGYVTVSREKTVAPKVYRKVVLAREILGLEGEMVADHIDRNSLDSRRHNLRPATRTQNAYNSVAERGAKVPLKGVYIHKGRFRAHITANGRRIDLGLFKTAELAHATYCKAARELHGEFARFG